MPGMTLSFPKDSEGHAKLLAKIAPRVEMAEKGHQYRHEKWRRAEDLVNAYVPESVADSKRARKRESEGYQTFTTLQIPYSYALLMAAHTYWTSVFFARDPVHQFTGRHGESENQVQGLESLVSYQMKVGGALAPYYLWLYDAGKYGAGILGTYWGEELHQFTQLQMNERGEQEYVTQKVWGYKGNKVYNVSPWDFLPDPRVPVNRFQEGEFVAVRRQIPWNQLILRRTLRYYMNIEEIKHSGMSRMSRELGGEGRSGTLRRPEPSDFMHADNMKHPAWVEIYEVYIDLIPSEWNLGSMGLPEKWVFTILGDKSLIIGAQPLGLAHNRYPFDVIEPEVEAYGLWNRGIPETIEPIQNCMDWLVNAHFYNVRAVGNGRFIVDPSGLFVDDLEEGEPGFVLQVRPEAQGRDVRTMFQQLQTTDVTQNHMNDFRQMFQIGEQVFGINEQILGALSGSGRKTATEVRTSAGFGVNRLKTMTEYMSAVGMSAHSMKLVQQTQQYQEEPIKIRIVGDLLKFGTTKFVNVTPEDIAGFYDFIPVDGTLPVDRFAQATLWKDILGQLRQFPQIAAQYDFAKIFAWMATLAGVKNVEQFRMDTPPAAPGVEVLPDEVLADQAQRGNVIPYQGSGPGTQVNRATTPAVGMM